MEVHIDPTVTGLMLAWVEAQGLQLEKASGELERYCHDSARRIAQSQPDEVRRAAVRDLLRQGGFKPAGRNKPAQEYLFRSVEQHGQLPVIVNAVDWLNVVSIESALPISLLAQRTLGERVEIRYGSEGESFVFNASGQELNLQGLICLCAVREGHSHPIGTPVKDSMEGKLLAEDRVVAACIYAPQAALREEELRGWADHFAQGLKNFCGCTATSIRLIKGPPRR